nr:toprim domain-containing protein [Actinorhabdospora filicis]
MRPLSASTRADLEEATAAYQAALTLDAAQYLDARGITRETAHSFRVGTVADPRPGHTRFTGWLAIPYLSHTGYPLSLRFRCLADHDHRHAGHGKYMSISGETSRVFNVGAIHRAAHELHVCEGELDALILTQLGLHAIAIPGATNWKPYYKRMLAGFTRVWVWGDRDDAGDTFNRTVCTALRSARAARLPAGDVTDTYLSGGAAALHALIT